MKGYKQSVLNKYNYPLPSKPQHSPHRQCLITYGVKQQLVLAVYTHTPPALDIASIRRIQVLVGAILYYNLAV